MSPNPPPRSMLDARLLAAVVATGFGGAALLAAAVLLDLTGPLDRAGYALLQSAGPFAAATAPVAVRETMRDVTALGGLIPLTAAVVATVAYLAAGARYRLAALMAASALLATLANLLLKGAIDRARPDLVGHLTHVSNPSFPSGHALLSASIILTIAGLVAFAARRRREKAAILVTAALICVGIGASRVWLGVHWPSDVLAGWLIGAAWAAGTLLVARPLIRRHADVAVPEDASPLTAADAAATPGRAPAPSARSAAG